MHRHERVDSPPTERGVGGASAIGARLSTGAAADGWDCPFPSAGFGGIARVYVDE